MKAVVYHGPRDFRVETVPDPSIQAEDDLILRVTSTAICGSDLHMYHGNVPGMKPGDILGHEFMGIVEEVGPAVTRFKPGDRVIVPFAIGCGHCYFCTHDLWSCCETTNPDTGAALNKKSLRSPAALYGYTHLYGGVSGGQAEYVRVLKGNANPFAVPEPLTDEQVLFLTDILPTGYQAAVQAGILPGASVAIYGAGPVGLMAAMSARHLGADTIYMIDEADYRLSFAEKRFGVIPINFHDRDAAGWIVEQTDRRGVDVAIDAVGFEAKGSRLESAMVKMKLEGSTGAAIRQCIAAVRRGGTVSIPGVYAGFVHGFLLGDAFDKGLTFKMGQTHVQRYVPELLELIQSGVFQPDQIITHRMPLSEAPRGYAIFDAHEENCRKIVLKPLETA